MIALLLLLQLGTLPVNVTHTPEVRRHGSKPVTAGETPAELHKKNRDYVKWAKAKHPKTKPVATDTTSSLWKYYH